jgi:hypothetical protein
MIAARVIRLPPAQAARLEAVRGMRETPGNGTSGQLVDTAALGKADRGEVLCEVGTEIFTFRRHRRRNDNAQFREFVGKLDRSGPQIE